MRWLVKRCGAGWGVKELTFLWCTERTVLSGAEKLPIRFPYKGTRSQMFMFSSAEVVERRGVRRGKRGGRKEQGEGREKMQRAARKEVHWGDNEGVSA